MLEAMEGGEVDDEAMVELAIALSLQEQDGQGAGGQGGPAAAAAAANLEQLVNMNPADLQGLPALQGLAGMLGGAIAQIPDDDDDEVQYSLPI